MIGFERHDHQTCIADGLQRVEAACAEQGLQLTAVRRRVMEILLAEHRAMGAYDILDILRTEKLGSQPPVVYRALDFLVSHRFVHKIERLNAFIACAHPQEAHIPTFLICRACDAVAEGEVEPGSSPLGDALRGTGFKVEQAAIEAVGLCPRCQAAA